MLSRKHPIHFGDSFDISIGSYFIEKEKNREINKKINDFIYKKKYKLNNTGTTYRAINHWTMKGLIDDERKNEKGWRKFNLMDILWINIIAELRLFDFGIQKLLITKKNLLKTKEIFEYYIMEAYTRKREIKLIVFENGEADLIWDIEFEKSKIIMGNFHHISISFTSIIEKVLDKKLKRSQELSLFPISEKDKSLLFKIYEEENSSFTIKTKNGRIKKYKLTNEKVEKVKDIKNANIRELIEKNINSKIYIYTNNNGKITDIDLIKNSD